MCRWTGCLFELPALAQGVISELLELAQGACLSFQLWATNSACILLISQAIISRIPSLFPSLRADSLEIS